jgi:hypothetical protein
MKKDHAANSSCPLLSKDRRKLPVEFQLSRTGDCKLKLGIKI